MRRRSRDHATRERGDEDTSALKNAYFRVFHRTTAVSSRITQRVGCAPRSGLGPSHRPPRSRRDDSVLPRCAKKWTASTPSSTRRCVSLARDPASARLVSRVRSRRSSLHASLNLHPSSPLPRTGGGDVDARARAPGPRGRGARAAGGGVAPGGEDAPESRGARPREANLQRDHDREGAGARRQTRGDAGQGRGRAGAHPAVRGGGRKGGRRGGGCRGQGEGGC